MPLSPRHDRVLIQRIGDVERIGSIYLPDSARERSYKGVILAVGPGKWEDAGWWKVRGEWKWFDAERIPLTVHVGQTVLFHSKWNDFDDGHTGENLPLGADATLHLVQEADIFGVIPDA